MKMFDPSHFRRDAAALVFVLGSLAGTAVAQNTTLFVSNEASTTVSAVTPGGVSSIFATGFTQTGGLAYSNTAGLFVADQGGNSIYQVSSSGTKTLFASGSGLNHPTDMAFDGSGNLFVINFGNNTIAKVTPGGVVSTFVSSGLSSPQDIAVSSNGTVFVSDSGNSSIDKITTGGLLSAFAQSNITFNQPHGLAFDGSGNLLVGVTANNTILKLDPSAGITNFATGVGSNSIFDLAFDPSGNLMVSTSAGTLLQFNSAGAAIGTVPFASGFSTPLFIAYGSVSAIPEPSTYAAIAGVAMLGFAGWRRRRQTPAATRA
jgi:glucose/arabinose dehydrogenase